MTEALVSLPAGLPAAPTLLATLLDLLPLGVIYYTPVLDATGALTDLTLAYLNPAAQRITHLPAQPDTTYHQQFPTTAENGAWDFHRRSWLGQAPEQFQFYYDADGFDSYFRVTAQRLADGLLVTFTDTQDEVRSQAEQALLASQARERERTHQLEAARAATERERAQLHALLTQAPVAIGLFEGDELRVSAINPLMAGVLGYEPGQLLGHPLFERAPELQGQGFDELMRQVQATQVPYIGREVAATVQRAGQPQQVYFNFVYQPLYDDEGRVTGVINVAVDVTEQVVARRQVEQLNQELEARVQARTRELSEQQALLGQILGQVPAAIATLSGPEHHFSFFNEEYQRLNDQRTKLGAPLAAVVPEAAEQGFTALLDEVYRTGQPYVGSEVAVRLRQADGLSAPYYVDFRYQPLHDEAGRVQGILIFAIDVTEQVLGRQQQLVQAQRLRHVFAQAPVAIFVLRGADYVFDVVNESMGQLLGMAPDYVLGKRYFDLLPALEGQGYRQLLDQVWHTGQEYIAQEQAARLPRHGANETGYYNFVYVPLHEANGRIEGILCVAVDVTAQVLTRQQVQGLNDELQASNAQLTRTNADLDTFVYTASHDLKAPITNIEGLLLALRRQLPPEAQQAGLVPRLLELMQGAIGRFQQTLGHLTEVSRLHYSQSQPAEAIDLAALVEDVRLDILPELTATGATLQLDLAGCPTVYFPPKNLRSVVYNLLSNAVKYHAPDRPPLVQVRCHRAASGSSVVAVQDNGLGLTEQQQGELFHMFRRLHTHVEGSGVGLYMVKKLLENAGGRIAVQSQLGVGTTFTVTLPAAP